MEKTTEELHCLCIVSNLKLTVAVTRARNRLPMTLQWIKQMKSLVFVFCLGLQNWLFCCQKQYTTMIYINQDGKKCKLETIVVHLN
jgi:hypothetical protein